MERAVMQEDGMGWWSLDALDRDDPLNQEIWNLSPGLQSKICDSQLGGAKMAVAAQALVGPPILPWVPDLVGSEWKDQTSVLVVGASYADFFTSRCRRPKRMQLHDYRASSGPADFQSAFLRDVVIGYRAYYEPIADLLDAAGVPLRRAVITDLCRASFVRARQEDASAEEAVLIQHEADFLSYVSENEKWHNQRLKLGKFKVIIA